MRTMKESQTVKHAVRSASGFLALAMYFSLAGSVHAQAYFFSLNRNASGTATVSISTNSASSAADQADTGTIWNNVFLPTATLNPAGNIGDALAGSTAGDYTLYASPLTGLVDSFSNTTALTLQIVNHYVATNNNAITGVNQSGNSPDPSQLMGQAWRVQRGENSTTFTITGLTANQPYDLYFYGSGNAVGQGMSNTLAVANQLGVNPIRAGTSGTGTPIAVFDVNGNVINQTITWDVLHAQADSSGDLVFTDSKLASGQDFMNGFQIQAVPEPSTIALVFGGLGVLLGARTVRKRSGA
jgi:hypothetical protein